MVKIKNKFSYIIGFGVLWVALNLIMTLGRIIGLNHLASEMGGSFVFMIIVALIVWEVTK